MGIRLLGQEDEAALDAFLGQHRDSSMLLRSNLRHWGLVYRPAAFHGQYLAAFDGERIVAVIGHVWNGMLLMQMPEQAAALSREVVALSGRRVAGLLGPREQVVAAREALGLNAAPLQASYDETLFGLDLAKLVVPKPREALEIRPVQTEDRETLSAWRVAYGIETLEAEDTPEERAAADAWFDRLLPEGSARVATQGDVLLSLSAFNASLPDMVQLGGIYTPPAFRRRHYARSAIAASLIAARENGVQRAVLFANDVNAIRCYESLGFEACGEFGLVLFA